jgi:hypothetical protein
MACPGLQREIFTFKSFYQDPQNTFVYQKVFIKNLQFCHTDVQDPDTDIELSPLAKMWLGKMNHINVTGNKS